jgi:sugar (pentulose or hexulose) kinase
VPLLVYAGVAGARGVSGIGGGAKNDLLLRIKASVLGTPLHVAELVEATALGAALLGGYGAGVYPDARAAAAAIRACGRDVAPTADDVPGYDAIYRQVYAPLSETLRATNHRIHALASPGEGADQDG